MAQQKNLIDIKLSHNEQLIKSFLATCKTGYDLGVSNYHKNWCVFVKQGKNQDFIKFIDLSDMTIEEIRHFEKQLDAINQNKQKRYYYIDAPMGIKDHFMYK